MTYIPNGTILTWEGQWSPSVREVLATSSESDISARLSKLGMSVTAFQVKPDILARITGGNLSGSMEVRTTSGTDYGNEEDVRRIIDHGIYEATGTLPIASRITNIRLPPGKRQFGQPGTGTTVLPGCESGFAGWIKSKLGLCVPPAEVAGKGFLEGLTSSTMLYFGLILFGLVAGLALIGYAGGIKRG